jgi:hypothetical protein
VRSSKVLSTVVGPGRSNVSGGLVHGGPAVYAPFSRLYHPESGKYLGDRVPQLPPSSLTPKQLYWMPTSSIKKSACKYRIALMFHEVQDFPDVQLDELEMELQYCLVEHVHRMAIGAPIKLGEENEESRSSSNKTRDRNQSVDRTSGGSNVFQPNVSSVSSSIVPDDDSDGVEEEEDSFILCPIKHVRMHYLASGEEGLREYFTKTKVPLRILVRARRGDAFATAMGNTSIKFDRLAAHISAQPQSGTKVTVMLPVEVPPLGLLIIRLSIGFTCLSSMSGNETFAANDLRVTKVINQKGGIYWFPEDHYDLVPLPSAWMGSFNLDLEARSRAIRNERRKKRRKSRNRRRGIVGGLDLEDDETMLNPAEIERNRVLYAIEENRSRLLDEMNKPENRTARQKKDILLCQKVINDVQSSLATQSQSAARSQSRLLVLAHTKLLYDRRMHFAKREDEMLSNLERHNTGGRKYITIQANTLMSSMPSNQAKKNLQYLFREELHSLFQEHCNSPQVKRSRRFRRSGSLDGNARGEKRIILSEEEQSPMIPLEKLMAMAIERSRTVNEGTSTNTSGMVSLGAASPQQQQDEERILPSNGSPQLHSGSKTIMKRKRNSLSSTNTNNTNNMISMGSPQDIHSSNEEMTEEERMAEYTRVQWFEFAGILERMKASGMYRARWSDLMAAWNSIQRHRSMKDAEKIGTPLDDGQQNQHDFLMDQEAGLEIDFASASEGMRNNEAVHNIPGEVDGLGGGDDEVKHQTIERRWIRIQAAKYIFDSCVSNKIKTDAEKELSVLEIDVFNAPTSVVDVIEVRAFMRGVIHATQVVRLKQIISRLEEKLVRDLDEVNYDRESPSSSPYYTSSIKKVENVDTVEGEEKEDATPSESSSASKEETADERLERLKSEDPTSLHHEENFAMHDHLYYYARAIQRAAIEMTIAIESS